MNYLLLLSLFVVNAFGQEAIVSESSLFPKNWEKIEIGLNQMPGGNPGPLKDSDAFISHESTGAFTGDHLILIKDKSGDIKVTLLLVRDGEKKSQPLEGVSFGEILDNFEVLDRAARKERSINKVRWNPKYLLRVGYRIKVTNDGRPVTICGMLADQHSPATFKKAKTFLRSLSEVVADRKK